MVTALIAPYGANGGLRISGDISASLVSILVKTRNHGKKSWYTVQNDGGKIQILRSMF